MPQNVLRETASETARTPGALARDMARQTTGPLTKDTAWQFADARRAGQRHDMEIAGLANDQSAI